MLKSLRQTVATPLKNTGLLAPSNNVLRGVMFTKLPFPGIEESGGSVGYMVCVVGANIAVMRPEFGVFANSESNSRRRDKSASQVLG